MLKPATGFPVFAISATMRSVHFGSMPMTMAAAQFGLRPCAGERAEGQIEVGAELQAAVGVRQRHRALDVVGDGLGGGVREIVDRDDEDVIAHAEAPVGAAIAPAASCPRACAHPARGVRPAWSTTSGAAASSRLQRSVRRLCVWTWLPRLIGCTTWPMGRPYLSSLCPAFRSRSATLWPSGTSWVMATAPAGCPSSVTMPTSSPALRSRTATPTSSIVSWIENAVFHEWISLQ